MTLASDKSTWTKVKFGAVIDSITKRIDNPSDAGVDRYVGLEHLDPGTMVISRWGTPDQVEATKLLFEEGDVIFGRRRAYQRKVSMADFSGICSAHALVLRAKPGLINPLFLPVFLSSDTFLDRAIKISVGSLSPTVNWKTLATQEFLLPPIEEQEKIASTLWSVESHLSNLANLRRNIASLQQLFLNERVISSELEGKRVNFADVGNFQNGYPFKPADLKGSKLPVIRIKQLLDADGKPDFTDLVVDKDFHISDGDIIFSWSATLAVKVWTRGAAILNQHLYKVTALADINPDWLRLVLEASIPALKEKSHGTTMQHITKKALLAHQITLPSEDLLKRMLIDWNALLNAISAVDKEIESVARLRKSLLGVLSEVY
jgi:restriction endonuclease S subunit